MNEDIKQCYKLALIVDVLHVNRVISDSVKCDLLDSLTDVIINKSYEKGDKTMAKSGNKSIKMLVENNKVDVFVADLNRRMKEMNHFWNIKVVPVDDEVSRVIIG